MLTFFLFMIPPENTKEISWPLLAMFQKVAWCCRENGRGPTKSGKDLHSQYSLCQSCFSCEFKGACHENTREEGKSRAVHMLCM